MDVRRCFSKNPSSSARKERRGVHSERLCEGQQTAVVDGEARQMDEGHLDGPWLFEASGIEHLGHQRLRGSRRSDEVGVSGQSGQQRGYGSIHRRRGWRGATRTQPDRGQRGQSIARS